MPPGSLVTLRRRAARRWASHLQPAFADRRPPADRRPGAIDALFFGRRLAQAMALRDRLIGVPFYRLIHAEADGLPGVIVDRFGDALVVQVNTPAWSAEPVLLEAIELGRRPTTIVRKAICRARARGPDAEMTVRRASSRFRRADRERRDVRGRPPRRPQDRLVLRPARQPPLHGGPRQGRAASSTPSAIAAASACWPPRKAPSSVARHRPLDSRRSMPRSAPTALNGVEKTVTFEKRRGLRGAWDTWSHKRASISTW